MSTVFCKHYHGMQNPCDVGVDFQSVRVNLMDARATYPCWNPNVSASCQQALYPTQEEQEEEMRQINMRLDSTLLAISNIRRVTNDKRRVSGKIACPVCGKQLSYSVASNGHIHGKCETDGCLHWLE